MMVLASSLFAVMGVLVKTAGATVTADQIVLWRSVFSALPMLPLALRTPAILRPTAWWPLVLRSLSGTASMYCYFFAISRLPLGDAVVLSYASPLWVAVLSPWLIGEPSPRRLWLALGVGFLGVALVAGPSASGDPIGIAAALATSLLAGIAYLYVRVATRTDRNDTIVFWFGVISAAVFAPAAALRPWPVGPQIWSVLVATGVVGLFAQLAMTRGYSLGAASRMSIYNYLTPVLAYVAGMVFLGELPSAPGLAGTALVAVAGTLASRPDPAAEGEVAR
jgi:drug/metabolite transporter (DMT)-like permease